MSISSELTKLNTNMQNAYTAVSNKGGTLPASQNMDNLATAINSISGGGGGYTEFPSYQVSNNGVASKRSGALTGNEFSNITSISSNGLYYAFYNCSGLTGNLNFSSLTSVDSYGLYYAFFRCTGLTSVDLSSLTSVDSYGLYYAFYGCTGLTSVDLSSLTSVDNRGLVEAFFGCKGLTSVNLSSLTTVDNSGLYYAFYGCTGLKGVYFNSLTTTSFGTYKNQFKNMMYDTGTSVTHTLHFPRNLQSTISGLTGYPTFGGTSGYVVCAFDLPSTS